MKSAVVGEARQARDRADVKALSGLVDGFQKQASQTNNFGDYVQAALFEDWLCEAAFVHKDSKLVRQAAEAGIRAAEKAVELDPKFAEAHWLLGDLVGNFDPSCLCRRDAIWVKVHRRTRDCHATRSAERQRHGR